MIEPQQTKLPSKETVSAWIRRWGKTHDVGMALELATQVAMLERVAESKGYTFCGYTAREIAERSDAVLDEERHRVRCETLRQCRAICLRNTAEEGVAEIDALLRAEGSGSA